MAAASAGRLPAALRSEWLETRARASQLVGDFRRAHADYARAWRLISRANDPWRLAEVSLRLGDTARQLEMFHAAMTWYDRAAKQATAAGNRRLSLDALSGHAMSLRGLGRYDAALKLFARLLRAYRDGRDREGAAYALWAMGTTERFAGRLAGANRHLAAAVQAYKKLGEGSGLAYAWCGWGGTLRMMGYAKRSGSLYAMAYRSFRRDNDRFGMAYASCGQGNARRMAGQLAAALPFMARAERGYRALKLHGPLGFVLWSRAQLLIERNRCVEAARQLTAAEASFRAARDPRGLVYVSLGWAELAKARGLPAAGLYRKAAREARNLGLTLEETHARVRSGTAQPSVYGALGVSLAHFSTYRSLP